jgi:hypothetical protein
MEDELLPGIASWNAGEFCATADRFEDVWVGEVGARRECLRGLIHAAMGLHYAVSGDVGAARSKLATAARLLAPFPADFLGLDLDGLRSGVGEIRRHCEAIGNQRIPPVALKDGWMPRLTPASVAPPNVNVSG